MYELSPGAPALDAYAIHYPGPYLLLGKVTAG